MSFPKVLGEKEEKENESAIEVVNSHIESTSC